MRRCRVPQIDVHSCTQLLQRFLSLFIPKYGVVKSGPEVQQPMVYNSSE